MTSHVSSNPDGIPMLRHIPLEGAYNFRDIGGYETADGRRVRWHRIYRSGQIDKLTDTDVETLAGRRILTVVDLREKVEYDHAPDRLPASATIVRCSGGKTDPMENWTHMLAGATSGVPFMKAFYSDIQGLAARFKPFFQTLLDLPDDHALLLHCMAGKDRTGIGIALLMIALGVRRETIVEDYLLTNQYGPKSLNEDVRMKPLGLSEPVLRDLLAAKEEYLQAFFSTLEEHHGSDMQFLAQAIGLSPEKISRLREKFTE
ncbi:protein-tyrosine phosphatase [Ereboglobus sp. PH5-5]|uniref:tyrosine-protein phosphatase n=1 Tax=Ereboglobus sp. PH5-5 TaxID=2940529 RepID=UPI002406E267|nr:tyrosine-protein phosphatase [Ereboglobus sp. PH5-5]MDF9832267.1 protein-tyrosine phosphatase [Ereboglobus sp. PH5-5]